MVWCSEVLTGRARWCCLPTQQGTRASPSAGTYPQLRWPRPIPAAVPPAEMSPEPGTRMIWLRSRSRSLKTTSQCEEERASVNKMCELLDEHASLWSRACKPLGNTALSWVTCWCRKKQKYPPHPKLCNTHSARFYSRTRTENNQTIIYQKQRKWYGNRCHGFRLLTLSSPLSQEVITKFQTFFKLIIIIKMAWSGRGRKSDCRKWGNI